MLTPIDDRRASSGYPVIVVVTGAIDGPDAAALRELHPCWPVRDTVVDLTATGFCCAAGVGLWKEVSERLDDYGAELWLAGAAPALRGLIGRLGLGTALPCADTVEDAVAALHRSRRRLATGHATGHAGDRGSAGVREPVLL